MTYTHGDCSSKSNTRSLYKSWFAMHQRCENPNDRAYKNYGARGIWVCWRWYSYLRFKKWALANGWKKSLTIDRIDNDGHYCPENCQWLTKSENAKKSHKDRKGRR